MGWRDAPLAAESPAPAAAAGGSWRDAPLAEEAEPQPPAAKPLSKWDILKTGALGITKGIVGEGPTGIGEAALEFGTGMATTPVNEITKGVRGAFGGDDQTNVIEPYQPETRLGKITSGVVNTALAPVGKAIDYAADTENPNPAVRATGHLAKGVLGLAGMKGFGKVGSKPLNPAIENARNLKLSLDPRQIVDGKPIGTATQRAAAVLGGKAAVPADASLLNQPRIKAAVAEDLGLPKNESISQATIDRLRKPANDAYKALQDLKNANGQPYRVNLAKDSQYLQSIRTIGADAVSGVTKKPAPAITALVRKYQKPANGVEVSGVMKDVADLRFDASKHFKSDDPGLVRQARAERAIADALEDTLDRQVGAQNPQVIKEWREARVQLAKLHTVEDALVGTEIDARLLAKAQDSGAKLSGNMEKLAEAARAFPTSMQTGASMGSKSGLGLFDAGAMGVGSTIGALIGGLPGALVGAVAEPAVRLGSKRVALGPGKGVVKPRPLDPVRLAGSGVLNKEEQRRRAIAALLD